MMARDLYEELHLRRVVNASGTLTAYGQSVALPEVAAAVADALLCFFEMDVLHARASQTISRVSGAQAGFVTASAAAGITIAVAACMAGTDPAQIAQLPDTTGMKNEVLIQMGHCCNFGAPVTQMIRLAGAEVKIIGTINGCSRALMAASLSERTAAALYVISHHTVQYGMISLHAFIDTAHQQGVPVIVDAAAEEHLLPEVIAACADLVVCSGHKHFRAMTSGLMAGRLELIQACYAQNRGIGRGMKIGKEGIIGLITALEIWAQTDHEARRDAEKARVQHCVERLRHLEGIHASQLWPEPDPYPIARVKIRVDPEACGLNAMVLSLLLSEGDPSIKTRAHHVDEGYFLLDPFTLTDAEMAFICQRIEEIVNLPDQEKAAVMQRFADLTSSDLWQRRGAWPYLDGSEEES
jgi:D-glucosaminate-6-phosphate ammonia-lyase